MLCTLPAYYRTPVMVGEAWSWKGTFCPDSGPANLSGLYLASPRFSRKYCPDFHIWPIFCDFFPVLARSEIKSLRISWNFDFRLDRGSGCFKIKMKFCPDWLLAFLQNFHKICPDPSQASPTITRGPPTMAILPFSWWTNIHNTGLKICLVKICE